MKKLLALLLALTFVFTLCACNDTNDNAVGDGTDKVEASDKDYIVARKGPKLYMKDIISTDVDSITTESHQNLCLGSDEAEKIKGKRVLIIDDVISTGASLTAVEELVEHCGGNICGKAAVLAEGDAALRDDIIFLEKLPLFNSKGQPID